VSYLDGFAGMADLKRDLAILATNGPIGPTAPGGWLSLCRTSTSFFRKAL
jgi:hypothetical protein